MHIPRILTATALMLVAFVLPAAASAGPASALDTPDTSAQAAQYVADQLLVKLADDGRSALPPGYRVLREIPELGLALVEVSSDGQGGQGLEQMAAQLTEEAGVEWAEPNYTIELDAAPNDPGYSAWQLPYLSHMEAAAAWDYTQGRPETIIAVLDTGVDMGHEDLAGASWMNPGETPGNNVDDDGNGFVDDDRGWDFASGDNLPDDDHGHGTHVAGIAAARINNGKGIAGMAGHAKIMPIDVFQGGIGTYEALIRAIIYATDNGARVINMSLGASSYSKGEEAAVDYAYNHGVVVVAAAGNKGNPQQPDRQEWHYPAAHVHVIAVASTTASDALSGFSSRGEFVDVAAPGSLIYSTMRGNRYGSMSGTSMAAPHVAGLAALILSRNPFLGPDQVRRIIESTADDLKPAGPDIYFGVGRINAGRALAATSLNDAPPPVHQPRPGQDVDLPGCTELLQNGSFEAELSGWEGAGAVEVVTNPVSTGTASLHFSGGPSARGMITQTVTIPAGAYEAVFKFDYRIDPDDGGAGSSPQWPFDDWFTAEWRSPSGELLGELLRSGNTADTVSGGLQWDSYLYRLDAGELSALRALGPLQLVFTAQNDSDSAATDIWLDGTSFCLRAISLPHRVYLPFLTD